MAVPAAGTENLEELIQHEVDGKTSSVDPAGPQVRMNYWSECTVSAAALDAAAGTGPRSRTAHCLVTVSTLLIIKVKNIAQGKSGILSVLLFFFFIMTDND